jgi:hemoglobin
MSEPHTSEAPSLYDVIGGAERLRELVDRFYDLMQLEPEFAGIHAMHPLPNDGSREKLFMFLSGWMGGPDLFIERYGHPRLRARHLPFAIGTRNATSGCARWPGRWTTWATTKTCGCG